MAKLVGRLVGRLICPSMTDETLGLLLRLPLFRLNPLLVRSLAGDGGVVLVEEAMAVKRFGQVPNATVRWRFCYFQNGRPSRFGTSHFA